MGMAAIPLVMMAAGTAAQAYSTQRTAKRQDAAAAEAIRNQGLIQQRADARVNEQVDQLAGSNSADERARRLDQYMESLRAGRSRSNSGLSEAFGSEAFRRAGQLTAANTDQYGADTASLMARMDAPQLQRQGEAFGYGNLATDIGLIGRESAGRDFIDQLRISRIKRNPWLDAVGGMATAAGGAMAGRVPAGVDATSAAYTPVQYGGQAVYNSVPTRSGAWGVA